jgi:hypothetical protein
MSIDLLPEFFSHPQEHCPRVVEIPVPFDLRMDAPSTAVRSWPDTLFKSLGPLLRSLVCLLLKGSPVFFLLKGELDFFGFAEGLDPSVLRGNFPKP